MQLVVGVATQTVAGLTQTISGTFTDQPDFRPTRIRSTIVGLLVPALLLGVGVTRAVEHLATPFIAIYRAVLYVDQRRRKEAAAGLPLFA